MKGKRCAVTVVRLLVAAVLSAGPLVSASGFDRSGARTFELERDLRTVRPRVEREPRASAYDLRNLQRRLHDRQIDSPRDPRLPELGIETRRLRWQADRDARRSATAAGPPRTSALATGAPILKPRYLGGAHTPPETQTAALDFGRRVVALQQQIAEVKQQLEQGEVAAAAHLLEAAEADLALLRGALSDAIANDPNLLALESQLGALRHRLE